MGVNSLPKTVTRQRSDCDLNPGPSAPESSTLTTRLPSHPRTPILLSVGAGGRQDGPSGDAACGADWVPLIEDNRLTTIESSISRT